MVRCSQCKTKCEPLPERRIADGHPTSGGYLCTQCISGQISGDTRRMSVGQINKWSNEIGVHGEDPNGDTICGECGRFYTEYSGDEDTASGALCPVCRGNDRPL